MKKLSEKIFYEYSVIQLFLISFIPSTIIFTPLFLLMEVINGGEFMYIKGGIVFGILIGVLIGALFTSMVNLGREGDKFYRYADKVEKMVTDNEPLEDVVVQLRKLDKQSFHRTMSSRVREVIKMAEVKYDVKLLKR